MSLPITNDPDGPRVEIVTLTPAKAKKMLEANTHNRGVRPHLVDTYSADMVESRWMATGDPIRVARDGTILDGQHRLMSIIKTGVTMQALVISNLDPATQDVIDTGAKRTFGDVLKLRGEKDCNRLAALTKKVYLWENGYRSQSPHAAATHSKLSATLDKHPEIRDSVKVQSHCQTCGVVPSVIGLCHWLFNGIDPARADLFFLKLERGTDLSEGDPILALRRAVNNMRRQRLRPADNHVIALVIKAWNAWRDEIPISRLTYHTDGPTSEAFPEPH